MKTVTALVASALLAAAPAWATSSSQDRMKQCSADFKASNKPSSERQAYMKDCLGGKTPAAAAPAPAPVSSQAAQQNKMKTCSADFKKSGKPSGERQAYMKECLKA